MHGIINIYKEKGFTSHDVVAVVRKTLNIKKVGHTGTLDPEAEGVLPVCIGKGTKLADYIMAAQKQYLAELTLGVTTTTEDASGEILKVQEVRFDEVEIKRTVQGFIGEIEQIPPMYSAIKINGKKMYELAREGKEIERKSRTINIYNIEITQLIPPNRVKLLVDCSKGTYIRTLCKDIGEVLGCGGHMSGLLRTRSGNFTLDDAVKLDELKALAENGRTEEVLLPLEKALSGYKKVTVAPKGDRLLLNGGRIFQEYWLEIPVGLREDETVTACDSNGNLVGLFRIIKDENRLGIKPVKILFN